MKTITANATTELAKAARTAFWIVKVEWDAATAYYSDAVRTLGGITTTQRIARWSEVFVRLGTPAQWALNLRDDDGSIRTTLNSQTKIRGHKITLYWAWPGAVIADWVLIFGGVTDAPYDYDEQTATVSIPVTGLDAKLTTPATTVCDLDTFPYANPEDFGRDVPLVYGKASDVHAIWAEGGGPVTRLTSRFDTADTTCETREASGFPASSAGSPIKVWIGSELVEGWFDSNGKFTATTRPITLKSGLSVTLDNPTWPGGDLSLMDVSGVTEADGYWMGDALAMRIRDWDCIPPPYDGPTQYRRIVRDEKIDATNHEMDLEGPWSDATDGNRLWRPYLDDLMTPLLNTYQAYTPPAAHHLNYPHTATITTRPSRHERGMIVHYAGSDGSCVYIVNDQPSSTVDRVYVMVQNHATGETEPALIPTAYYTVNLNDNQFAGDIGHNVTTITFRRPPWLLRDNAINGTPTNEIHADIQGPTETGSVIENPARIIRHFALNHTDLAAGDINDDSIDAAQTARADWRMAFTLEGYGGSVADILNDLAKQACLAVDWSEGKLRLVVLDNDLTSASSQLTLNDSNTQILTRRLQSTDNVHLTTEMTARYKQFGEPRILKARSSTVSDYGIHRDRREEDYWAYNHRNPVKSALAFWLHRWGEPHDIVQGEAWTSTLRLQLGDIVTVASTEVGFIGSNSKGWVSEIRYAPGGSDKADALGYAIEVPKTQSFTFDSVTFTDIPDPTAEEQDQDDPPDDDNDPAWIPRDDYAVSSTAGASRSRSRSVSQKASQSRSASQAASYSRSASKKASQSRSGSRLASASRSGSRSASRSGSQEASQSRSTSRAPFSQSRLASRSRSASQEASQSRSGSLSASASRSGSQSASASRSESRSQSRSLSRSKAPSCTFSDGFNRSDGALGANWSQVHPVGGADTAWFSIVSNKVRLATEQAEYEYTAAWYQTQCNSNDHYVSHLHYHNSGHASEAIGRGNNGTTFYGVRKFGYTNWGEVLFKVISGSFAYIGTSVACSAGAGVVRFRIVGDTLYGDWNGAQKVTATDSSITTGKYMGFAGVINNVGRSPQDVDSFSTAPAP